MLDGVDERLAELSRQIRTAGNPADLAAAAKRYAMLQQLIRLDQFIEMLRADGRSTCGRSYNRALDDVLHVIQSEAGLS